MAKQTINIGSTANDGTGSTLRVGGDLINDNFNEIYTVLGSGSALAFDITGVTNGQALIYNSSSSKFEAGAGTTFTLAGDSGDNQSISGGDTLTVTGGTGISTSGSETDTITVAIDTGTTVDKTTAQTLTNKTLTSPKINEDVAVTSTATELNLLDGATVVIPAKVEGTNFTDSIIVGHSTTGTLTGASNNTAVGLNSLQDITSGGNNVAIGRLSLQSITSGSNNVAAGYNSLGATTTGSNNVAFGRITLDSNIDGIRNSGFGDAALHAVTTGTRNIGIGFEAGTNITTGSGNVIIGQIAADAVDSVRTLKIAGNDGSTTTTWISGDNTGAVTINDAYTLPTADGSANQILTTDGSGAVSFADAAAGGGITELDTWRLHTGLISAGWTLTTNLERADHAGFGYLGSGMSESSGVFTFPSTGYWLVQYFQNVTANGDRRAVYAQIFSTHDNSTYVSHYTSDSVARVESNFTASFASVSLIVKCDNTSNVKVKFGGSSTGACTVSGNTSANTTYMNFMKLAEI